jgi:hypothetical protein
VTGNRWTTPIESVYFNGKLLSNTTQQPSTQDDEGIFFALVDSGNPSLTFPTDMMTQIVSFKRSIPIFVYPTLTLFFDDFQTNAYAGNADNATV